MKNKQIFLDCGAYTGISIDFFNKYYPNAISFEKHSFECLPDNIKELKKRNTIVHEYAAWSSNGTHKLYTGLHESGSLYKEKTTGNLNPNNYIIVKTIDLAQFIINNFKKDDYIIIKLNIEGAEYEVIPHLKKKLVY